MNTFFNLILKQFVTLALRLYFRRWKVVGLSHIPRDKPVIFASNHHNAFLDALLITCSSNRLPYYLARAGVFSNSLAANLLKSIRIMPIYRFRDGLGNVKKNDAIIEACTEILGNGHSLVMFPEGNHGDDWYLRPFQRGVSRIAFSTQEVLNWKEELYIVPVGIQYEEPRNFKSRVLVQFGKPIEMSPYREVWKEDNRKAYDVLKEDLFQAIQPMMIHLDPKLYEEKIDKFRASRNYERDLRKQLESDQQLARRITTGGDIIEEPLKKRRVNPLSLLLALPAWIINILPYMLIRGFVRARIKDPVFSSSIKLALGMLLMPLYYLILSLITGIFTGSWIWGVSSFFILVVISSMGADALVGWYRK